MALSALGDNPCSTLNSTVYPNLWIPSSSPTVADDIAFPLIASGGNTQSFLQILNNSTLVPSRSGTFLRSPNINSTFRLFQFMSGGGGATGSSLDTFLLKTSGGTVQTIIDTYIIGSGGLNKPTYTGGIGGVITDAEIDTIRGALITAGYLLSRDEIYNQQQLTATDTSTVSSSSATLLFLSKVEQTASLSDAQRARKTSLETKNLRFYSAFLAEYCFYRTRYQWLLQKYFTVYNASPYTSPLVTSTGGALRLFNGSGTNINQYEGTFLRQDQYLKGLAFHMAVINTRMNDLRRLLSSINTYYSQLMTNIQGTINEATVPGSNADLTRTINALQDSSNESKKYMEEAQFRQGLVKYTQEKNKYSNILLSLYAVLNVAALAMIYKLK
jgi:hypothetical protein